MTNAQREMVERLEDLVSHFLAAGPVSFDSLGRAGEKLSNLSALIFLSLKFQRDAILMILIVL